jgi:hypothetical protein
LRGRQLLQKPKLDQCLHLHNNETHYNISSNIKNLKLTLNYTLGEKEHTRHKEHDHKEVH